MKSYVAYYRVSTKRQGESGLGLDAQKEAVRRFIGTEAKLVAEHEEVESGKRADRPALDQALRDCRVRGATLVIAKLDRLSRSVAFIAKLMEERVDFVAVDNPQANSLTVQILAAMAEHERNMISERTKAALAAAKARGVRLGGRRGEARIEDHAARGRERSAIVRRAKAAAANRDRAEIVRAIQGEGVSGYQDVARTLNARSIPAPRGGAWSAGQVRRLIVAGTTAYNNDAWSLGLLKPASTPC